MKQLISLFTSKPVEITEKDDFFKKGFRYIFMLAAIVLALFGIYSIISVSIDYFKMVFDLEAFQIIRHLLLFFLCLIVSVLTYVFLVGAFYNRSRLIMSEGVSKLVDIMPDVFKTLGIVTAIIPVSFGLIAFFSSLLAATPFFPLNDFNGVLSKFSLIDMPVLFNSFSVDGFDSYIRQLLGTGFMALIISIFAGFVNLVAMYLVSAIYKLVIDFLRK